MTALPYPRVVVWRGGQVVGEHALPAGAELVVGRSEGCGIVVGDGSVSRMHARLVSDEQGVHLEDLGSANGTYVDGARVQGRVRLRHGQQVRVAQKAQTSPVVLRFEDPQAPLAAGGQSGGIDVGAATVVMRSYEPPGEPRLDSAPAVEPPARAAPAIAAPPLVTQAIDEPPLVPPAPAAQRAPLASTTPMRDATPPAAAAPGRGSRRGLLIALLAITALGALAAAAAGGWWWLRSQAARRAAAPDGRAADSASPAPPPAHEAPAPAAAPPVVPAAAPALAATPAEAAPSPTAVATAVTTPSPLAPATFGGKWTARLENLFYPEGDYVVTLRLDLRQRGNALSGRGQAAIESSAMTFGVPAVDASGSVRPGAPPRVRLRLPFSRPIGELELEGTFENGAFAGTYRSSLINQPGTWQAARDAG